MKLALSLSIAAVSCAAISQTFPYPTVLSLGDVPIAVVYGPHGGWRTLDYTAGRISYSPLVFEFANSKDLPKLIKDGIDNAKPSSLRMSRAQVVKKVEVSGWRLNLTNAVISEVHFPACDVNDRTPNGLRGAITAYAIDRHGNWNFSAEETAMLRGSSPWRLADYSVEVEGVDTTGATVDPYTWRTVPVGDLDGDGVEDFAPDLGTLVLRAVVPQKIPIGGTVNFQVKYVEAGGIVIVLDGAGIIVSAETYDVFDPSSPPTGPMRFGVLVSRLNART